jgi:ankyrin repeat protein
MLLLMLQLEATCVKCRLFPQMDRLSIRLHALHRSVCFGKLEVANYLLGVGVPPDHESYTSDLFGTPLHAAAGHNYPEAVALLLGAGAQDNSTNSHGETPLSKATMPVIRLLVDGGSDINAGSKTLLHNLGQGELLRDVLCISLEYT